jgi:hypothetical protein
MSLELIKAELQQVQNLAKAAQEQLELLELRGPTTPRKKGGGPFRVNQIVRNLDTGELGVVLYFPGKGKVGVRSLSTGRVYEKYYRGLEACQQ